MSNWYGALAPAATPLATRQRLEQAFAKVIAKPELARKLADAGSPARWARRSSGPSSTPTWTAGCP